MVKILTKAYQALKTINFELFCVVCCLVGFVKVKLLFSEQAHNRLEIGAGRSKKQGVVTSDLDLKSDYPFDLRAGLPFPDESIDFIYAEHVLEHFQYTEILIILEECKRVMKPGAVLKISVPDARIYLNAYCDPDGFDYKTFCTFDTGLSYRVRINYVNYIFYMDGFHRYMFDDESLLFILNSAGFDQVCTREYEAGLDQMERMYESLYAQCVKV